MILRPFLWTLSFAFYLSSTNTIATPKDFSFYDDHVNFEGSNSSIAASCIDNVEKYYDFNDAFIGSRDNFLKALKKINRDDLINNVTEEIYIDSNKGKRVQSCKDIVYVIVGSANSLNPENNKSQIELTHNEGVYSLSVDAGGISLKDKNIPDYPEGSATFLFFQSQKAIDSNGEMP